MARIEVVSQAPGRETMPVLTWTDLGADGIKFKNTGAEEIILRRDQVEASNITISTNVTTDGLDLPDLVIAMAAGDTAEQFKRIGPFPMATYNQAGGWVHVDSDDSDDMIAVLTVAVAK